MLDRKGGNLFRERSLDSLNSPERLDQLITVVSPSHWLMLAGATLLSAAAAAWLFFGTVPIVIHGQGLLLSQEGLHRVAALRAGAVRDLLIQSGNKVAAGQVVATLEPASPEGEAPRLEASLAALRARARTASPAERPGLNLEIQELSCALSVLRAGGSPLIQVRSPRAGRVLEVLTGAGAALTAGAPLLTLAVDGKSLEAILFVPFSEGRRLHPDMAVQLFPASVPPEGPGQMMGTVVEVGELPASPEAMLGLLQNPRLVEQFSPRGEATLMVRVRPLPDGHSPGGYRWTSREPAGQVHPGTLCRADFVLRKLRPFDLGFRTQGNGQGQ